MLPVVIEEAARAHEGATAAASLRLLVQCAPSLRTVQLLFDAGRIRQVVTNFLSNAIKFTPAGGTVTVRADVAGDPTSTHVSVRVSVADTGVGLAPAELSRLFQPYTQIRAAEMQAGCVAAAAARRAPLLAQY